MTVTTIVETVTQKLGSVRSASTTPQGPTVMCVLPGTMGTPPRGRPSTVRDVLVRWRLIQTSKYEFEIFHLTICY